MRKKEDWTARPPTRTTHTLSPLRLCLSSPQRTRPETQLGETRAIRCQIPVESSIAEPPFLLAPISATLPPFVGTSRSALPGRVPSRRTLNVVSGQRVGAPSQEPGAGGHWRARRVEAGRSDGEREPLEPRARRVSPPLRAYVLYVSRGIPTGRQLRMTEAWA